MFQKKKQWKQWILGKESDGWPNAANRMDRTTDSVRDRTKKNNKSSLAHETDNQTSLTTKMKNNSRRTTRKAFSLDTDNRVEINRRLTVQEMEFINGGTSNAKTESCASQSSAQTEHNVDKRNEDVRVKANENATASGIGVGGKRDDGKHSSEIITNGKVLECHNGTERSISLMDALEAAKGIETRCLLSIMENITIQKKINKNLKGKFCKICQTRVFGCKLDHAKTMEHKKNKKQNKYCRSCNKTFNTRNELISHFKSPEHRANMKLLSQLDEKIRLAPASASNP